MRELKRENVRRFLDDFLKGKVKGFAEYPPEDAGGYFKILEGIFSAGVEDYIDSYIHWHTAQKEYNLPSGTFHDLSSSLLVHEDKVFKIFYTEWKDLISCKKRSIGDYL